jgi:hypothetical protein
MISSVKIRRSIFVSEQRENGTAISSPSYGTSPLRQQMLRPPSFRLLSGERVGNRVPHPNLLWPLKIFVPQVIKSP